MCRAKQPFKVQHVQQETCTVDENYRTNIDTSFVGPVSNLSGSEPGWYIKLSVSSQEMTWCIDSGAQVTLMPETMYNPKFGTWLKK